MRDGLGYRAGWLLVLLVGCDMLPPPPPPKFRTAPATTATSAAPAAPAHDHEHKPSAVPRGPNSAPEHFKVKLETTKGDVVIDVHRHLAPYAADRFHQLVKEGFYDGCKFFRVVMDQNLKIVQFGMNGDPETNRKYQTNGIPDEPRIDSNVRGTISFAKADKPNSRTSQLFLNVGDNSAALDSQGFAPFGRVVEGLDVVDKIANGFEYADIPDQGVIASAGNTYLNDRFPNLDDVVKATIIEANGKPVGGAGDAKGDTPKSETPTSDKPEEKSEPKPDEEKKPGGE